MRLQYQLSNGSWVDCKERTDEFFARILANTQRTKTGFRLMSDTEVRETLSAGEELRNDPEDWYSVCRDGEAVERILAARRAAAPPVRPVKCTCGHTVRAESVMNASLGSSCPDCYDRMSAV